MEPEQFNKLLVDDVWPRFPEVRDSAAVALSAAFAAQWEAIREDLEAALAEALDSATGTAGLLDAGRAFAVKLDERIQERLRPVLEAAALTITAILLDDLSDTARETAEAEILRTLDRQMDRITWVGADVALAVSGAIAALSTEATLEDALQEVRDQWGRFETVSAQRIANTETVGAFNSVVFVAAAAFGAGLALWNKVWNHVGDRRVRPAHRSAGQQTVPQGGVFIVGGEYLRYPGDPFGSAAMTANCFPAFTKVASRTPILAGFRSWYRGRLVVVQTRLGDEFTGTPNHPILTSRGWVPLGDLAPGDHLIRDDGFDLREPSEHPHVDRPPATIAEVFDTFRRPQQWMMRNRVNFHGDRPHSDVEVVGIDGFLRNYLHPMLTKHGSEMSFAGTDEPFGPLVVNGSQRLRRVGITHPASSGVGGGNLVGALRVRHRAPLQEFGISPPTRFDTARLERVPDGGSTDTEMQRDRLLAHLPNDIEVVEVDGVGHREWSGHVFTLQTAGGLYAIDNGYVVQNCRCFLTYERPTLVF